MERKVHRPKNTLMGMEDESLCGAAREPGRTPKKVTPWPKFTWVASEVTCGRCRRILLSDSEFV
jgi:hypothetical protein